MVDAVFDGIGGDNLRRSREASRGAVAWWSRFQAKLQGGRIASGMVVCRECQIRPSGVLPARQNCQLIPATIVDFRCSVIEMRLMGLAPHLRPNVQLSPELVP
jgi:hypothetical protein